MPNHAARVNAVILAGGGADDRLARAAGVASKALAPIDGVPMAAYVLSALRASEVIEHVVYVGPTDERVRALVDHVIPAGRRMVDSLALGAGAALALGRGESRLLVATADLPWWHADGVARFVTGSSDADLVYPVVAADTALAAFPNQRRTFARLREGRFTGGNAVLATPAAVTALLPVIDQAFTARKAPWRLAALIGLDVVVGLVTGRASLTQLEARVSRLLGVRGQVFVSDDAGIAADVDGPHQLEPAARQGRPLTPLWGDA